MKAQKKTEKKGMRPVTMYLLFLVIAITAVAIGVRNSLLVWISIAGWLFLIATWVHRQSEKEKIVEEEIKTTE